MAGRQKQGQSTCRAMFLIILCSRPQERRSFLVVFVWTYRFAFRPDNRGGRKIKGQPVRLSRLK